MKRIKILVFEKDKVHRDSAYAELSKDCDLYVVQTYDEVIRAFMNNRYDVFMTDLLFTASSQVFYFKEKVSNRQDLPLGALLVFLALQNGVKRVAVMIDVSPYDHFASAAVTSLRRETNIGDTKVIFHINEPTGPMQWKRVLTELLIPT